MAGPLEGIRTLDLTRNVAGPFATKLLADYGADVLKVEPTDGDPSRRFGPFHGDDPHPEKSALFLHLNTNKRSITLDPSTRKGGELARRLAAEADVVVEDFPPGTAEAWGFGWETLSQGRSDLVMASITPFGQSGPYRDYRGSEITLQAIGGPLLITGHAEKEPLKLGGHTAHYHAGAAATLAILLARLRVEMGGEGDYIDLAVYECQAGSRDRRTSNILAAAYTGYPQRRSAAGVRLAAGVRPCLDGYVNVLGIGSLEPFLEMIGREDLLAHPDIGKQPTEMPQELVEQIEGSYLGWLMQHSKHEVLSMAQERRLVSGSLLTVEDLLNDPHYGGRGVWDTIDHPFTGPLQYAGRPMVMSASPRPQARRAPLLGEHNVEVYVEQLGLERDELAALSSQSVI